MKAPSEAMKTTEEKAALAHQHGQVANPSIVNDAAVTLLEERVAELESEKTALEEKISAMEATIESYESSAKEAREEVQTLTRSLEETRTEFSDYRNDSEAKVGQWTGKRIDTYRGIGIVAGREQSLTILFQQNASWHWRINFQNERPNCRSPNKIWKTPLLESASLNPGQSWRKARLRKCFLTKRRLTSLFKRRKPRL